MSTCCTYQQILESYQSEVPASHLSVLLYLVRTAGAPCPIATIMLSTGLSRGTVFTVLRMLESSGRIVVDRSESTHRYTVVPPADRKPAPPPTPIRTANERTTVGPVQKMDVQKDLTRRDSVYRNTQNQVSDARASAAVRTIVEPPPKPASISAGTSSPPPQQQTDLDDFTQAQLTAINTMLDQFQSIREKRPADLAMRILRISRSWNRNGFVAAALLDRIWKRVDKKRDYQPRKWAWCPTVLRNEFQMEARAAVDAEREQTRIDADHRDKVQTITDLQNTPRDLPFKPRPGDEYTPDFVPNLVAMVARKVRGL